MKPVSDNLIKCRLINQGASMLRPDAIASARISFEPAPEMPAGGLMLSMPPVDTKCSFRKGKQWQLG